MSVKPQPIHERIMQHVEVSGDCWRWTGTLRGDGEPLTTVRCFGRSRGVAVRTVLWEERFGEAPEGMRIVPSCLTNKCVNPDHLHVRERHHSNR